MGMTLAGGTSGALLPGEECSLRIRSRLGRCFRSVYTIDIFSEYVKIHLKKNGVRQDSAFPNLRIDGPPFPGSSATPTRAASWT